MAFDKSNCKLAGAELVTPYNNEDRKSEQVEVMFDAIAPAYDFMNNAMTFGLHTHWRTKALDAVGAAVGATSESPRRILDIATGTGEVAFELHRRYPEARITGIDLSEGMLAVARKKLALLSRQEQTLLSFEQGDSLELQFADNTFDMVTVAYGVRNFEHLGKGYEEMGRVLRKRGILCVIELSEPDNRITKAMYRLYSRRIIPAIGKLVSGDSRAYSYLPESIAVAPQRREMTRLMEAAGLSRCEWHSLTFGAVCYYLAIK
ncbi:MAG: bifunctional demethylmenaquinone methyltransferase/2-methoxy-6-polyprenyl-1,4-benzoquinol methylase UbiE [Candidatus Amulumruptor caecigallinarius]|nr:bifunctional demethylmenaquinone methyltransferase/2-methoxy-6-polyprenyl-1,4-benzoquinol methylase UbiE [Candidatus Amulumruptor caecigallinarius]